MNKTPKLRFKEFSEDWQKTSLKKVTNGFEYGMNSASTEFDGENKYIRITDIDENTSKYIDSNVVSPLGELEDKYLVKENDILFARTGASAGKTYLYDSKDGKLYFAGFLIRANVNTDNNAKFIFLQTKTRKYDKWVKVMSMRSGQPGINSQEYSSYSFNCPSKEEQGKIASFFSLIDKKISLQSEKVEMLKEYKKGMMQKIFSRELRFKDDSGRDYPEWEDKKLGKLIKIKSERNKNNEIELVLSVSNTKGFIRQADQFEDRVVASSDISNYKIVENGDFAFNPARINVGSIARLKLYDKGVISPMYICFKTLGLLDDDYLEYFLMTSSFDIQMKKKLEGSVRQTLSAEALGQIVIKLPCLSEQKKIGLFLNTINDKLKKEEEKLDSLNEYKKGLLQQMFV